MWKFLKHLEFLMKIFLKVAEKVPITKEEVRVVQISKAR